jgi:hypothetical protein
MIIDFTPLIASLERIEANQAKLIALAEARPAPDPTPAPAPDPKPDPKPDPVTSGTEKKKRTPMRCSRRTSRLELP